jgi:hypothetical protein
MAWVLRVMTDATSVHGCPFLSMVPELEVVSLVKSAAADYPV